MLQIRLATVDDAGILAELVRDVQRLHADALPDWFKQPDDVTPFVADMKDRILADPDGYVFIAEVDGIAAGYVYAQIFERPEDAYAFARKLAFIDQISVKPAYRGKGCGRALIEAVFKLARTEGVQKVALDTWAFNTEAHEFFYKMGFKVFNYRMDTDLTVVQTEGQ